MLPRRSFFLLLLLARRPLCAATPGVTSSLSLTDLAGSEKWPPAWQKLCTYALGLTSRKLTYQFGSADPSAGGMDCSGTIYYLLKHAGIKNPPRTSPELHRWVKNANLLVPVIGTPDRSDPVFAKLTPGDLLFWTGTYETGGPPSTISHVMMYLGKTAANWQPVMFGASNGRTYQGKSMHGVSVFDFRLPNATSKARFTGYGPIPGLPLGRIPAVPPG